MSIISARQALTAALIAEGAALPALAQDALAEALTKSSPVDSVVAGFNALRALSIDLPPATLEALRSAANAISAHDYHGLAADAASLLELMPPPAPQSSDELAS